MFGSNGPCSPMDYLPHYTSILEPIYYPSNRDSTPQIQSLTFDSDPDCHSSAPPTPDVISGLISLTGGPSPSDMSSGSFGDLTSPEDYHSASSPPSYSLDVSKVNATRTQLIKEGLKLTIQSRRMVQGLDNARPEYRTPPHEERKEPEIVWFYSDCMEDAVKSLRCSAAKHPVRNEHYVVGHCHDAIGSHFGAMDASF
ncbi:BZIP domain-containing protein [Trichonephila clavipes]|nr:BZIP domain-containing protein [Trichonephila clavipes]